MPRSQLPSWSVLALLTGCAPPAPNPIAEVEEAAAGSLKTHNWEGNEVNYYIHSSVSTTPPSTSSYQSCTNSLGKAPCVLPLYDRIQNSTNFYNRVTALSFKFHSGTPPKADTKQHLVYAELDAAGLSGGRSYGFSDLWKYYGEWLESCHDVGCTESVEPYECDGITNPTQYEHVAWWVFHGGPRVRPSKTDNPLPDEYDSSTLPLQEDWLIVFNPTTTGYITNGWRATDGRPEDMRPWFDEGPSETVLHETGHVLGMIHEQKRPDAQTSATGIFYFACYVEPSEPDCGEEMPDGDDDTNTNLNAFEPQAGVPLSPYDVSSIMQYPSGNFQIADDRWPLLSKVAVEGSTFEWINQPACGLNQPTPGYRIARPLTLSPEDINILLQMYPPVLGKIEAGDQFGAAMVAADFDGDGYSDLAIGSPGEIVGSSTSATGSVFIYKGTYTGLVQWKRIDDPTGTGNNRFGAALAAANLEGMGGAELVIGAPTAKALNGANGGTAWVYSFNKYGPVKVRQLDPQAGGFTDAPSASNDQFGAAIAIGNFDGTSYRDIAVGAPGRNWVYTFKYDGSKLRSLTGGAGITPKYGAALASDDLDGDGKDDILIGAPGNMVNGIALGAVYVAYGTGWAFRVDEPSSSDNYAGDAFGTSVAIGSFMPGGALSLVVGAPGHKYGEGQVSLIARVSGAWTFKQRLRRGDIWGPTPSGNVAGTRFGQSLVVLDRSGLDFLVVGSPGNAYYGGYVFEYRGDGVTSPRLTAIDYWGIPDEGNGLGTAVAAGNFNKKGGIDVAVGSPGAGSGSGLTHVLEGDSDENLEYWDPLAVPPGFVSLLAQSLSYPQWR